MKKLAIILVLLFLSTVPVRADGPYHLRFPVVHPLPYNCQGEAGMSDWKVVVPSETEITNKVLNPSGETTGNFAAEAGTTVTRSTTYQHYGLYSYRVETNANNEGIQLTLSALANAIHYVTARVRGTLPTTWDWSLNGSDFTSPTLLEQIDSNWALYGLQFSAAQANGSTTLEIHQNGTGSGDFYLDGIQVEEAETWSTYIDGTQPGCEWNGAAHASTSTRSANSRAGGVVYDLEDDYGLNIGGMSGTGTAPQELFFDSYASLPGGELNSRKVNSRVITLSGVITGTTQADFYSKKQALENLLDPDAYPEDENGVQPIRLRFTGATTHKEIAVHYETGLEGEIMATEPCAWERVAIRFIADDPYWYEYGESATVLDTNDSATFRIVAGRLRSTGQWDDLGPPNAAGTYTSILAIAEDATYVYFGGNFLNFDNIANADRIVRYNKQTGAYSAIDSGLNGTVHDMTFAPNGDLYVVGDFTNASGVAAADHIAKLAAGGSAFEAVGTPVGGTTTITTVRAIIYAPDGNIYIGGDFENWADVADADYVVKWTGSAYDRVGVGPGGGVLALLYHNGLLYAGGTFSGAVASFTPNVWTTLGNGLNNAVQALAPGPGSLVYLGGTFTQELTTLTSYPYVTSWNGQGFISMAGGADAQVYRLSVGPDGTLYLSGTFTEIGGISVSTGFARWNEYAFAHPDLALPTSTSIHDIFASQYADPVDDTKYSIYIGHGASGTGNFAGLVTSTNDGTSPAFPKVIFTRSGGTTATVQTLKNERTGQELLFDYDLLDGETLTIDLTPTQRSVVSSFFGSVPSAVLANSDLGSWQLLKGSNQVTSFVSTSGSPTVTAYLLWKDRYNSQN